MKKKTMTPPGRLKAPTPLNAGDVYDDVFPWALALAGGLACLAAFTGCAAATFFFGVSSALAAWQMGKAQGRRQA